MFFFTQKRCARGTVGRLDPPREVHFQKCFGVMDELFEAWKMFFFCILVDPVGGLVKKHDTIFFGQKRRGFGVKSGV